MKRDLPGYPLHEFYPKTGMHLGEEVEIDEGIKELARAVTCLRRVFERDPKNKWSRLRVKRIQAQIDRLKL